MAASLAQLNNISREMQEPGATTEEGASGRNTGALSSLQELDSLLDILRERTLKFPGARCIVHRVERLKQEVLAHRYDSNRNHHQSSSASTRQHSVSEPRLMTAPYVTVPISDLYGLFPFPKRLTPRLELLDDIEAESLADALVDGCPDWIDMDNIFSFDDINPSDLEAM